MAPPGPDASQTLHRCLQVPPLSRWRPRCPWRDPGTISIFFSFRGLKNDRKKWVQRSQNWSPKAPQVYQKMIKSWCSNLYCKLHHKIMKHQCPQNLKNRVFALEGLHFFKVSSNLETITKTIPKCIPKFSQNHKKCGLQAFRKRTSKTYPHEVKKWSKKWSKMGSQKVIFLWFFWVWVSGCPVVVPRTLSER